MTHSADLTGRARIRMSALRLFSEQGFSSTSLRAIATDAGVSHALVRHHFGSKEKLREAVDEDVLDAFDEILSDIGEREGGPENLAAFSEASVKLFGTDAVRREYLRRALAEGSDLSARLFARLLEGVRIRLSAMGGTGGHWAPYQVLFLILGPMLLEPAMRPGLDRPVFDPAVVAERSAANQRLLTRGMFPEA
ncbi:TetR/AcrR family transcriptional regulator [Nocardiopsis alborubida]|uniref:TetR/AcrR family transcriptional regulator n=1 Tax=Nocardiopsis alborubida TaxID=146802 RepID=A0A7X6M9G0_9ACTN|nr:TetR/AcrR family transcriptional regulator [Nocardiopsis alborubida]NKY97041.1 TetR/AcrR family transcriptional regulator [Nocardiopsis alborubida]